MIVEVTVVLAAIAVIALVCYHLGFNSGRTAFRRERNGAALQILERWEREDW